MTWAFQPLLGAAALSAGGSTQNLTQSASHSNANGLAYAHTIANVQSLTQDAWTSGNSWFDITTDSSNTWATYPAPLNEQVFYRPALGGPLVLTQSASFVNNNNVGLDPDVTVGTVTLTQSSSFSNSPTYYTHVISGSGGVQDLIQSARLDNAQSFYAHTVTPGTVTLSQSASFSNSNTLNYAHRVDLSLAQSAVASNTNTLTYTHQINRSVSQASRYDNANTLSLTHVVTPGVVALTQASRFDNTNGLAYAHTVSPGTVTLTSTTALFDSDGLSYAHTVTTGPVTVTQSSRYDSSNGVSYTHVVTPGVVSLSPSRYDNANTTSNVHVVAQGTILSPDRLDNVTSYFTSEVSNQYPDPSLVRIGVRYGESGLMFTGTNSSAFDGSPKLDIITGRLVKPVTNKVAVSLT